MITKTNAPTIPSHHNNFDSLLGIKVCPRTNSIVANHTVAITRRANFMLNVLTALWQRPANCHWNKKHRLSHIIRLCDRASFHLKNIQAAGAYACCQAHQQPMYSCFITVGKLISNFIVFEHETISKKLQNWKR